MERNVDTNIYKTDSLKDQIFILHCKLYIQLTQYTQPKEKDSK